MENGPNACCPLNCTVILSVVVAGCTSQSSPSQPVTPLLHPYTRFRLYPRQFPFFPSRLKAPGFPKTITTDKDTPAGIPSAEINMTINSDGTLVGNGGCNSYSGPYTILRGITTFGQGITVGPVVSTLIYCRATTEQEQSTSKYCRTYPRTLSIIIFLPFVKT
jgi:heat shock protein HslJ